MEDESILSCPCSRNGISDVGVCRGVYAIKPFGSGMVHFVYSRLEPPPPSPRPITERASDSFH